MARRRILVPVDFSTQSDIALEYAKSIASRLDIMISCIYIIKDQGLVKDKELGSELKHKLRRDAENKLSERVNLILKNEKNVSFELIITSGITHQKVLEKSIDLNVLMIIIGRSNSSLKRTKTIVSRSLVPVVVVNKQNSGKRKRLIFPINLEKPYSDKLTRAIEVALLLGAIVSVVAVIEKGRSGLRPVYLKKLKEIGCTLSEQNIEFDTQLLENQTTIASEILAFSNKTEYGIILLMTHQDRRSGRPYLKLFESEVLSRTGLPVVFLNPASTVSLSINDARQANHPRLSPGLPLENHFT